MGGGALGQGVVLVACLAGSLLAFNLEPKLPVIKRGQPTSYFGFSVAQHLTSNNQPWMLVGAPLGQNLQPGTNRSGALLKCPLSGYEEDCEQVVTDGKRDITSGFYDPHLDSSQLSPPFDDELKDGQWLGVNVRSQGGKGKVVVCAHRYVHQGRDFRWGLGLCHFLTTDLKYDQTLEPCRNKQRRALEDYGYCQAGTSADLLEDDTALLGAPGAFTCKGMMYGISVSGDYLNKDRNHYRTPIMDNSAVDKYSYLGMSVAGAKFFGPHWTYVAGAPKAALGSGQVVFFAKSQVPPMLKVEGELTGEGFASGYGSALAILDANGDGRPDLVVAAPFFMDDKEAGGAVYVYLNGHGGFREEHPYLRLTGPKESRFGTSIASAGDLNQDGFEDLAVGCPYSEQGSGSVYIYLGSKKGIIDEPSQVVKASEAFPYIRTFGYSLSGGVDLDNNSYPDLLVGAFESDVTVLLRSRPIIDIHTEVLGNLTNIDPNSPGCPAMPNSDLPCFDFKACFEIRGVSQVRASSLGIEYKIEAETFLEGKKFSRVVFQRGNPDKPQLVNQTITVRRTDQPSRHCSNEIVFLREGTRDIQSAIAFKLTYTLIQREPLYRPNSGVLPNIQNYPILNQQEASKIVLARFEKDCGENELCESDLFVKATTELDRDVDGNYLLVLGRNQVIDVNITIGNFGEAAYEAMMYISHPKSMSYIGLIEDELRKGLGCSPFNGSLVVCTLGNPYKNQPNFQTMGLRFDAKNLKDIENRLDFHIWANSTSIEIEEQNDHVNIVMTVIKMAELSIQGKVEPEKSFYGGTVVGESAIKSFAEVGPKVTHYYDIWNAGPWKASEFQVDIWWPHQVENGRAQGKWLLYLEQAPVLDGDGNCSLPTTATNSLNLRNKRETEKTIKALTEKDSQGKVRTVVDMNCVRGTAKCFKIECTIRNLLPLESAVIKIHSRLWNATLVEDYPKVDEVRIRSRAKIRISDEIRQDPGNDVAQAMTTCYPDLKLKVELEGIAWYIYAISILAGIALLSLIVYCLYKTGFFKRRRPVPTHTASVSRS